jgi:LEA14-like dessication related protein
MGVRRILAGAMLVMLGACSAVVPLQEPKLQVVGVELLRGDLLRQELRVRMRVQNPNDRQLPVRSITYEVQLGGEPFAHGESERDFLVPANGETEFDVSVTANAAAAVLKLVGSGRKLDAIEYRIAGKVALSSGMFRNIPFDQKGTLNLK